MIEIQELQLTYRDAFGEEQHDFMRKFIDVTKGSWMKDLNEFIDNECRENVFCETNDKEKVIVVINFLIQENEINKYKRFIDVWKKHDPAKAEQFEKKIKQKLQNQGLTDVDKRFQVVKYTNCGYV